jgi:hypothetical protein
VKRVKIKYQKLGLFLFCIFSCGCFGGYETKLGERNPRNYDYFPLTNLVLSNDDKAIIGGVVAPDHPVLRCFNPVFILPAVLVDLITAPFWYISHEVEKAQERKH